MAYCLRSSLPHLRHAALCLNRTKILPHFSSPGDGIFMFRRLGANEMGSCSQKVIEVDDCGKVESHASLKKGKSRTPVKGKSVLTIGKALELIDAAKKGESRKIGQPIDSAVESHAPVKTRKMVGNGKGHQNIENDAKTHVFVEKGKLREHKKWLNEYLKKLDEARMESIAPIYPAPVHDFVRRVMNEKKKEMANWDVMKLCKQKRVYDIVKFPPEVLRSNKLLYQLFEAWMIENEVGYKSKSEKMWRFEDFKFNVFLNDEENECSIGKSRHAKEKSRLGLCADYKPGMIPIVDCRQHYDSFTRCLDVMTSNEKMIV